MNTTLQKPLTKEEMLSWCPYPPGPLRDAWIDGFCCGEITHEIKFK